MNVPGALHRFPRAVLLAMQNVGPGWFTVVMGTGILAICATISPVPIPFGHLAGILLWTLDAALFALMGSPELPRTRAAPSRRSRIRAQLSFGELRRWRASRSPSVF